MEYPLPIKTFLADLAKRDASLQAEVEPGGEKAGNWWIDLPGKKRLTIEWRPKFGFGFFSTGSVGYGEGPTEILRSPERAAHRVTQLVASAAGAPATKLRELRELYEATQDQLAALLNQKQASISRVESGRDSKIETISKFVQGLGGEMEIRAIFPDAQLSIYHSTAKAAPRKTHGPLKSSRPARA